MGNTVLSRATLLASLAPGGLFKRKTSSENMIEINNLTTDSIDKEFLKKIVKKVLKEEKREKENLSIALIGPNRMRELNRIYRGKNRVTDVLSFQGVKALKAKLKIKPLEKIEGLGEIVICLREVKKNARKLSSSFESELVFCLIHGVLHLLGYEHEKSEVEAEKMGKKQQYYFSKVFS